MQRNNGSGCAGMLTAIVLAFTVGALGIVALTRGEVFKPQPSQAVISAAYATRARIENDAMRDKLAADLAHAKNTQRISESFLQTGKDLLIVAGGIGVIFLLVTLGNMGRVMIGRGSLNMRLVNPNKRGQFPVLMDTATGRMLNANMQTTPLFDAANIQALPPELQIEAYAWQQRANIAHSLSQTKTFATTANQERGLLRNAAMPAAPAPGQLPPPIVIGAPAVEHDDTTGIHMHDDPMTTPKPTQSPQARAVVETAHGAIPNDIDSEEAFNDFINRRN